MTYTPQPGDIGLAYSDSYVGRLVRIAQAAIGDWAVYSHAFIVLDDGYIIEALPGGAKVQRLDKYPPNFVIFSQFALSVQEREAICVEALRMEGTKYGWLDYLGIGLRHYLGNRWLPRKIHKRVMSSGRMICSQLVAEAYKRAGLDLDPNVDPQYYTPGDLANVIMQDYQRSWDSGLDTDHRW